MIGLALSDADIFKAKIYNYMDNSQKESFIEGGNDWWIRIKCKWYSKVVLLLYVLSQRLRNDRNTQLRVLENTVGINLKKVIKWLIDESSFAGKFMDSY